MIKDVRLPEISENVESGDVIKLLVSIGDVVEVDQPLLELETEKAVLEVPSPYKGKVTEILVAEGDTVLIDQILVKVDTADIEAKTADMKSAPSADTESEPTPSTKEEEPERAPKKARVGAEASKEAAAASESESDEGEEAPSVAPQPIPRFETPAVAEEPSRHSVPASPSLRRLARELGVDIAQVHGSGPGGRILKDDLTSYARHVVAGANATFPTSAATEISETTKWGPVFREPMSKVRKITARSMGDAWKTIPHVTQYDKVDITEMEEIRKQYSRKLEASGGKLTMTAILLKVAASALKVFPQFNASLDLDSEVIVYKRYYHIGVAVDTERGLLVPVVRAVDKKNITELAQELGDLAERARSKKITPDEMDGGTFTISNLGGIGGTNFSPIVYPPQVAILGVARSRIEPVYVNDRFEPRLMLPLSVSYDHRVIDGADGARFLRWIVQALEEPLLLALEG